MPSEMMDQRHMSSVCMASAPPSFFSNGMCHLSERQADCLKPDSLPYYHGTGGMLSVPRTKLAGEIGSNSVESLKYLNLFKDHIRKFGVDQGHIDSERVINQSTTPWKDTGLQSSLQSFQTKNDMISGSLLEAFSRKLILSSTDHLGGHSTNIIDSNLDQDETLESLEEIEARAIGDLLPDDDDLISGVTDCTGYIPRHNIDDADDDLFCSIGGMELEVDDKIAYPSNFQHPSRILFVGNIDGSIEDSELRVLFEQYGSIRSLYTSCKHRGFVRVLYYDLRSSLSAMKALQGKTSRNRILDVQFSFPKDNLFESDINEGIIEILNLDFSVSNDDLIQILATYGDVKEIREIPHKRHHKLVEFYDARAAQAVLHGLNGSDILGKKIRVLSNNPGVARWSPIQQHSPDLEQREFCQLESPNDHGSTNHGAISSYLRSPHCHLDNTHFSHGLSSPVSHNGFINGLGSPYSRSLPEYHECLTSRLPVNSPGPILCPEGVNSHAFDHKNGFGAPANRNWSNGIPYPQQWSNSPSMVNFPVSPSQAHGPIMSGPFVQMGHHFTVGSAPSGNNPGPTLWDRRAGRPQFNPSLNPLELSSQGFGPSARYSPQPRRNPLIPPLSPFDSPSDRIRGRRSDSSSNQIENKKQFELDIERIIRGEDTRTTLMIKNIPNKYTSKMLLAAIDENHPGTYDFIYLPIDFKNKCNVGYAFINMVDPGKIIPFFQTFNGKKWEKFNSEKVASLAYARIQGKAALVAHFQNSSLMNEDKRCRPILFQTQGPNAGDQEPFPMGAHVRSRHGRSRTTNNNEQTQLGSTTSSPSLHSDDSPSASDSSSPGSLSTLN